MSSPMDPEALTLIREEAAKLRVRAPHSALVKLLDHADHHAERAELLRAQLAEVKARVSLPLRAWSPST